MKSTAKFLLVLLAAAAFSITSCNNASETKEAKSEAKTDAHADTLMLAAGEKIIYQCPMHPEEVSDKPGKCSKCGMDLEKVVVKDTLKK